MGLKRLYTHRMLHDKPDAAHDYEVYDALATDTLLQQKQAELADYAATIAALLELADKWDERFATCQSDVSDKYADELRAILSGSKKV
jgi:hypothetical protein